MAKETYWIGDEGENKSCCIKRKIYVRGDVIPTKDVAKDVLDEWREKGLISDGKGVPVVVQGTAKAGKLEAEIKALKAKVDAMPKLQDELKALRTDNEEKAALIEKQAADIADRDKQIETLTAPGKGK